MKDGDGLLTLAGLAAGVSLVLGGAAMTIAVIGAARPPVSEYATAAQNAHEAVRVSWLWINPALSLAGGVWASGQVVLRRPLGTSAERARQWNVSNARIAGATAVCGLSVTLALLSVSYAIGSICAAPGRPITDSMSFSGLSIPLSGIGGVCVILSSLLFLRWWQGAEDSTANVRQPDGAIGKPAEAG